MFVNTGISNTSASTSSCIPRVWVVFRRCFQAFQGVRVRIEETCIRKHLANARFYQCIRVLGDFLQFLFSRRGISWQFCRHTSFRRSCLALWQVSRDLRCNFLADVVVSRGHLHFSVIPSQSSFMSRFSLISSVHSCRADRAVGRRCVNSYMCI